MSAATHWKAFGGAYCANDRKQTDAEAKMKLTAIRNEVTCPKCKKACDANWAAIMKNQPRR